jgi:nucleotide-binding universal stress UspA family protein
MYEHMLIPYDGTDESEKGARHGLKLAAELGSTVHGLYVIDLPGAPRALSIRDDEESMREEYRAYGEEVLAELGEMAADHGVDYVSEMRSGSPSESIVEFADEEGMDVIVMGSAFRGRLGNILGGTTNRVFQSADVPVITQRMRVDEV